MSAHDPKRTLAKPAPGAFLKVESRVIIGQGAWAVGEVSSNRPDRRARAQRLRSHFNLSRILSSPERAQASSNLAPGAPLAPIAPIVSSPSLMTTPPPKNITCGSLDNGAISTLPRSSKVIVSFLNETLV